MDPDGQARASGKLKQLKSANSIVQAGELLGSLQLEEGMRHWRHWVKGSLRVKIDGFQ